MKNISYFISAIVITLLTFLPQIAEAKQNKAQVFFKEIIVSDTIKQSMRKRLDTGRLMAELEESVQGSRKFVVLTRQTAILKAIREEQKFAKSDMTAGDAAFEGQLSNADYILFPEVSSFSFYRNVEAISNLPGKYRRWDIGSLRLNVKVVNTVTGQLAKSITSQVDFKTKPELTSKKGGVPEAGHFSSMAKKAAVQLTDKLVDFLFPMKIMKSDGKQVWFNRGQDGGLKKGQILNIYSPGEELIDPDSGENLGSAEAYAGQIKVIRVNPKFSIASIEKRTGSDDISRGYIVRLPN